MAPPCANREGPIGRRETPLSESFLYPYGRYDPPPRCNHPQVELRAQVIATNRPGGIRQYRFICLYCNEPTTGALKKAKLIADGHDLAAVPDWYSDWYRSPEYAPCARCGDDTYTELHHWAPKHLFSDLVVNRDGHLTPEYESWPTAWLCQECHRHWHRIVTPDMHRKQAS